MSLGTGAFNLPQRVTHYRVPLTPLADAMFQLLIFFMLSSSLTPYSLLTLKSSPESITDGTAETPDPPTNAPDDGETTTAAAPAAALWTVEPGQVQISGQEFDLEAITELADALIAADPNAAVILIVRSRATVQDITSVLEALRTAGVASVQVTSGSL